MKTLEDLYKENPIEYRRMVAIANEQQRPLLVVNDKLELGESTRKSKDYKAFREENYPRIKEQLDMLWHAIDEGHLDKTSNFYLTLKDVKDRFPKTLGQPIEENESE